MRTTPPGRKVRPYRLPAKSSGVSHSQVNERTNLHGKSYLDAESLMKASAALGVAFYVLGILSVNGYLFSLGVSDFSLVRARFVYSGGLLAGSALVSAFPLLIVFALVAAWRHAPHRLRRSQLRRWPRWRGDAALVVAFLISFVSAILFSVWVSSLAPWPPFEDISPTVSEAVYSLILIVSGLLAGLVAMAGAWVVRFTRKLRGEVPRTIIDVMSTLGLAMVLLAALFWAGIFMLVAYPNIPEQFGGGQARPVRLLLDEQVIEGARELGVPVAKNMHLSSPVDLIYDGSETYVIRLDEGQVIQLDKSMVVGIEA